MRKSLCSKRLDYTKSPKSGSMPLKSGKKLNFLKNYDKFEHISKFSPTFWGLEKQGAF